MRLTSEMFISALVRRAFSAGDFAAIEVKGAHEAGAIFIRQRFRDGLQTVYAPAPQSFFDERKPDGRLFEIRLDKVDSAEADKLIGREKNFDPDLWVIEIESDKVAALIDVVED
ncbi:DUF1491 family protein [Rhizobium sp. L1K21]|uniref:DUF1491 family protein n=1 Tax=Rhizobium sp. L1K21 TaxID=2954933 RepID=UPI002093F5CF|nr:DUF1491 family protein [Rhizobium sp. L1K21]MCO6186717.1 DUF1491 family protein [Rhizobium sp. L1K21]